MANFWRRNAQADYVEIKEENDQYKLFMAHFHTNDVPSDVWFANNECSNHMTGMKSMYKELD